MTPETKETSIKKDTIPAFLSSHHNEECYSGGIHSRREQSYHTMGINDGQTIKRGGGNNGLQQVPVLRQWVREGESGAGNQLAAKNPLQQCDDRRMRAGVN